MRIAAVGSGPALGTRALSPPEALQAFARFYYDTALSVMPQQIAALRAIAPITRVLYGTDFPFAPADRVRMLEAAFTALPFTPQEEEMVRHGNASRLFGKFAERCRAGG